MKEQIDPERKLVLSEAVALDQLEQDIGQSIQAIVNGNLCKPGYIVKGNRIVSLNLREMRLDKLPHFIGYFTNLQYLRIQNNGLQSVDFSILRSCTALTHLDLSNNCLSELDLSPLQDLPKLTNISFDSNQLSTLNMAPLGYLSNLANFSFDFNCILSLDLSPLSYLHSLNTLTFTNNLITELDISPLLTLPKLDFFYVDNDVRLIASPMPILFSSQFLRRLFDRIEWLIDRDDIQESELYQEYRKTVEFFNFWESWVDYRDRNLSKIRDESFLDLMIKRFFEIKDKKVFTDEELSLEARYHWRKQIAEKIENRFLNATDLVSVMKEYWEPSNENILSISLVEGEPLKGNPPEIHVYRYWWNPLAKRRDLKKVFMITWVRVEVWDINETYRLNKGVNHGYLAYSKKTGKLKPVDLKDFGNVSFPYPTVEVEKKREEYVTTDAYKVITALSRWLGAKHHLLTDNPEIEIL